MIKKSYIILFTAFLVIFILLLPAISFAWTGKCVGIIDGDTIRVMHLGKAEKIRLYGIDCPEKSQAFGSRAKKFTSDMVFSKIVDVDPVTTDQYGRTVAWISVNGKSVNR